MKKVFTEIEMQEALEFGLIGWTGVLADGKRRGKELFAKNMIELLKRNPELEPVFQKASDSIGQRIKARSECQDLASRRGP